MDINRTKVLFICTGNSARSQMAEALLRQLAGERYEAHSAGSEPKPVHPLTLRVLAEADVSTEGLRSKSLREYLGREHFTHVIAVCAHAAESCPAVWPGAARVEHMFFDDPAAATGTEEQQLAEFRRIRDEVRSELESWLARQADASLVTTDKEQA